jgi:hypothetical protein
MNQSWTNNVKAVFLDTATQIARHWYADSKRMEIAEQLANRNLYCSRYVQCQYKATLLNAIIALHNLLLRHKNLIKALQESKLYERRDVAGVTLTKAVQDRVSLVGLQIARRYGRYEEQIDRLRFLIEDAWEAMFNSRLKMPLIDETACLYADEAPMAGMSGAYQPIEASCTLREPQSCQIDDFWNKNRLHLQMLAGIDPASIEVVPKDLGELQKVKLHAGRVLSGESARGQRCAVHLSDAVICIETIHCPEDVAMHSINKKHFRPLGKVLGIECEPKD